MRTVFMLWHVHEFEDGHEDVKLLGVFSSKDKAEAALHEVEYQPGFKELPDGFSISEIDIDHIQWKEGYVTVD